MDQTPSCDAMLTGYANDGTGHNLDVLAKAEVMQGPPPAKAHQSLQKVPKLGAVSSEEKKLASD